MIFGCGLIFFMCAYAYLDRNLQKDTANIDEKDYTVPYKKNPDNKGIAFVFPDDSAVISYLDFENENIKILQIENFDEDVSDYFGYTADYTVLADYYLISGIVDRVGGVNINTGNETLRYTGVQAVELISADSTGLIKKQIISEIFNQISKNSFSKDDFIYIIENSKSDLSIIDCIYWVGYIEKMSQNIVYVN